MSAAGGGRIIVVSGVPRSGTSLMMQMLAAGGVEILTDGIRGADESNPRGYFELEAVKALRDDAGWLASAGGKAVKIVSALLRELPERHDYDVLFMRRSLDEVLRSQSEMLSRRGGQGAAAAAGEAAVRSALVRHLEDVSDWLAAQRHMRTLYVQHRDVLADPPGSAAAIEGFLARPLDRERMAAVVDPALHRQRKGLSAGG